MRCSRCGTELPADARFCSSCGASVAGPRGGGAQVRLRPVRRRRRLHRARRRRGPRGRPRSQPDLLPRGPRPDRTARRDDREVRRRCGDGRLRRAARAERRRGASRACGDQHPRGHRGAEPTRPEPRPPGARRRLHGRGDRLRRRRARRRARDGRRGEHGGPAAVRGARRSRRRRRRDLSPHASCVRLSGAGGRRREGQTRSGARVARGAFARGAGGTTDVDDAARRTGPRGAADPNRVGSRRHRGLAAPRHRGRSRRDRQVATGGGDRRRDRGPRASAACGAGACRTRSRRRTARSAQILRRAAGIYENDGVDVARQKLGTLVGSALPARARPPMPRATSR